MNATIGVPIGGRANVRNVPARTWFTAFRFETTRLYTPQCACGGLRVCNVTNPFVCVARKEPHLLLGEP